MQKGVVQEAANKYEHKQSSVNRAAGQKIHFLVCGKLHNVTTNGLILLHYAFVAGKYKVPNSGTASPQGPRPEARLPEPPHHVR